MTVLKDKCVFFAEADQCAFYTKTNCDKVWFGKGVHVRKDDAAALAYMIQAGKKLRIVIKEA